VVLDATMSPPLEVRNLAGNVREYTSDRPFNEADTDCWGSQAGVIDDPACPSSVGGDAQVRSAGWSADDVISPRAEYIVDLPPMETDPTFGYRCVYPATPAQ
jgi:formylglycine-generating enzyme required for sulfatase activity